MVRAQVPVLRFHPHEWKGERFPETEYLDALRADLEQALPLVWARCIRYSSAAARRACCRRPASTGCCPTCVLPLDADAEITLEANPGTFEAAKFAQFRASGVNRLSVGIQSFNETHLKALGRIHDTTQARAAVEIAAKNFDNFNLDLMFALPNQTLDECRTDIETALSYAPPHLSLYHLTLEPNTLFAKFPPVVPDDDASADMQGMDPRAHGRGRLRALRSVRVCEAESSVQAQPELLALRRLSRDRCGRTRSFVPEPDPAAGTLQAPGDLHRAGDGRHGRAGRA